MAAASYIYVGSCAFGPLVGPVWSVMIHSYDDLATFRKLPQSSDDQTYDSKLNKLNIETAPETSHLSSHHARRALIAIPVLTGMQE